MLNTKINIKNNLEQYIKNLLSHLPQIDNDIIFNFLINHEGETYRQIKSRKTLRIKLDNNYFIKIHGKIFLKEIIKDLLSFKWPFPLATALNERDAIVAVQKIGIKTLSIVGYGDSPTTQISFVLTEAIEPNISLDQLLDAYKNKPNYFKLKRCLIKKIAEQTEKLHNNGLNHRDYYICHYLLRLNDSFGNIKSTELELDHELDYVANNIYLIDLHRMQIREHVPNRYVIKDLSGLLFSIKNYNFTKTDYLRFIKYYKAVDYKQQSKLWSKVITKANTLREKA